jgi:4-amino-4-deoxy-L-arabinose transferase-like glycosyltransferase
MSNSTLPGQVKGGDPLLALALLLGASLSAYGLWWGWVESWSADEMAFRSVFWHGHFLEPADFAKPPFHTYVNFALSVVPLKAIESIGKLLTGTDWNLKPAMLWWSRIIQIAFLLGIVYLSFKIVARFAVVQSARIIALVTATSAGLVLHAHFLTADVPVTFWMLASFYLAQNIALTGDLRSYALAGLLTGVATATKYNGLAVGMAIPVFHFLANRDLPLGRLPFDRRLLAGIATVLAGFIVANPYAVLDYPHFAGDFAYNYAVTPVYDGTDPSHHSFVPFLGFIPEIIGWPLTAFVAVATLLALVRLRRADLVERATVAAALAVFLLYFVQFGRAPRVEVRFVLPSVPFLLISAAPLWSLAVRRQQRLAIIAASLLVAYNAYASFWVGKRFADDPRMSALEWIKANAPLGSTIESSQYTPYWEQHRHIQVDDIRMPTFSGRARVLANVFKSNDVMMRSVAKAESDESMEWYSAESLARRHPQFVALDSKYFGRFLEGNAANEYPQTRSYITDLLAGRLGYHIVFDETAQGSPSWLYPDDIDFVDNRIVILRRDN